MEGGWVTVLLHDYFQGVDLAQIPARSASPMTLVTKANLADYQFAADPSTWKRFDFRQLSRTRNPALKEYHFGTSVLSSVDKIEGTTTESNQDPTSQHEHRNSE